MPGYPLGTYAAAFGLTTIIAQCEAEEEAKISPQPNCDFLGYYREIVQHLKCVLPSWQKGKDICVED